MIQCCVVYYKVCLYCHATLLYIFHLWGTHDWTCMVGQLHGERLDYELFGRFKNDKTAN